MAFNYLVIGCDSCLPPSCAFQFSFLSRSRWRPRARVPAPSSKSKETKQERRIPSSWTCRTTLRQSQVPTCFVVAVDFAQLFMSVDSWNSIFFLFSCFYSTSIGSRDRRLCRRTRKPFGHPAMAASTTTAPPPPLPFRASIAPGR